MNYVITKGKRFFALLFTLLLAFSILTESTPQLVYANNDTIRRQADTLTGYDISFSGHTITYDETNGDGVITAVLGTYSNDAFTELTEDVTYASENRELSWTGDTETPYALNITNHTGSTIGVRLPSSGTETTISNNETQSILLDSDNGSHFEFFIVNEQGNGTGGDPGEGPPMVGNQTANIRLSAELTWDTSERQDNELDMSVRIAHDDGDATEANQVYWNRFFKGENSGAITTIDPMTFDNISYNYVSEESNDKTRFWFGSSLLTKFTEITITSYSSNDYTGLIESSTMYAASAASGNVPIFFDYRIQDDVVNSYYDHSIWFPISVTPGASYSIEVKLASTTPTRVENYEQLSSEDASSSLANSDVQVGNFGWKYQSDNPNDDDYIGGGRIEFVSLNYDGDTLSMEQMSDERGRGLSWSEDTTGGEAVLPCGAEITVKLIPDAGKQLTSFTLNGQSFQTSDTVSQYTFRISQGNFHLGAHFTTVDNTVSSHASSVTAGSIALSNGTIDSGTANLDVTTTNDNSLATAAANEGYDIDTTVDLTLSQLVYKGTNNASDAWRNQISDLNGNTATVALKLANAPAGDEVEVFHNHNGVISKVDSSYDAGTNTVLFTTTGFSNYTIASKSTKATGIKLNKTSLILAKGKSATLTATLTPSSAKDTITWESDDSKIASVSSSGEITAKKGGTTTITATTASGKKATCKVTVASITLNASSTKLQVKKTTSSVKISEMTYAKDKISSVKSNNTSVLKVSSVNKSKNSFKLTAQNKTGKATVTIKMKSGASASCRVTVQKGEVTTKKLTLSDSKLTIQTKKTATLTATRNPVTATEKITWTSSDTNVATVNKNGKISAKRAGTATITAITSNGKKAKCKVTVKNPKVTLKKTSVSIAKGKTYTIGIKSSFPSNDTVKSYKSSNTKIASVSSGGVVKGKKKGTATITVTMKSKATAKLKVTVK
ncbi:MAG: Ig-like domain-containing protein [Lachnospiraceae bacterium]|nr:Ig-like domain-containing protein [Lachnospiraceae bacterium]